MDVHQERIEVDDGLHLGVRGWEGSGVSFLLVHGLASNARLWDGVAGRLAAAGHRVVAVDQRGHGRSDRGDGHFGYAAVARDLMRLCEVMELGRPVLVGQSWGGNVVLEAASRHADTFRAVAAVDGGTIAIGEQFDSSEAAWQSLAPPALAGRPSGEVRSMIAAHMGGWPEGAVDSQMANFEVLPDGTIRPWLRGEDHRLILDQMWATDPVVGMPEITVPTLLLPVKGGDADWALRKDDAVARAQALIPDVEVVWLEGDHDVHLQRPSHVAGHLLTLAERAG